MHRILSKNDFTIVLPIRGTNRELKYMRKSIPSAVKLDPGELLFACDAPLRPEINSMIIEMMKEYKFTRYRIRVFERDPSWGFQLAHVLWYCYRDAKYDRILSFDIDSVVRKEVMLGYDIIGKNNVAVCSFTKKLLISGLLSLQRYFFYRLRVKQSDYVFSGVYWIHKPYFFANIKKDEYMKIINGVDTFLTNKIRENGTHKIITRKEKGVNALDHQNEDYPWRQFQTGIWIQANQKFSMSSTIMRLKSKHSLSNWRNVTFRGIVLYCMYKISPKLCEKLVSGDMPLLFVLVKSFMYGHPYLLKGYRWAQKHHDHKVVELASTMSFDEWGYNGGAFIKELGISFGRSDGTGF